MKQQAIQEKYVTKYGEMLELELKLKNELNYYGIGYGYNSTKAKRIEKKITKLMQQFDRLDAKLNQATKDEITARFSIDFD